MLLFPAGAHGEAYLYDPVTNNVHGIPWTPNNDAKLQARAPQRSHKTSNCHILHLYNYLVNEVGELMHLC